MACHIACHMTHGFSWRFHMAGEFGESCACSHDLDQTLKKCRIQRLYVKSFIHSYNVFGSRMTGSRTRDRAISRDLGHRAESVTGHTV